ncbi:hypothetical protein AGABI2DRAFT_50460, partial [Agaricus bisporus var. bisporus H97]|uniref:hypothetical protein n=1 Tax=Agaricus bisporus var. bisporus (strain H97 / ATCC MYA-4626 / FGSC 10389) TaxID=936046 RepID=UPI00029F5C11
TDDKIRAVVQRVFNFRACYYQIQVARAIYSGKHVIGCAPTGAGKTLSFWIPMLMAMEDRIKQDKILVISPLNLLAMQTVDLLLKVGIKAVLLTGDTCTAKLLREVEAGMHNVIVTNPEILMGNKAVRELFRKPCVASSLLEVVLDEGHCVHQWASFRQHFKNLGDIRYAIPGDISFYVASATLPNDILLEIREALNLRDNTTELIIYSNDRPDISLMVQTIVNKINSYCDLDFLIPDGFSVDSLHPPKFLVFFDNTTETREAVLHLRQRMPISRAQEIVWFNSTLSSQGREDILKDYKMSKIWGLCCTDAFGMGMDVDDIKIVVQYKATTDFCTLWQRFGRAARAPGHRADAILLVEKK